MVNFFKHLFGRPDYYPLVWVYLISKLSKAMITKVDISVLCARFNLTNSQVRDVLSYGSKYNGKISFNNEMTLSGLVIVSLKSIKPKDKSNDYLELYDNVNQVMEYFNNVLSKHNKRGYKKDGKASVQYIKKRLKDGYSVDDMKDVIDAKSDWLEDKNYHKYFRPQTLFSEKFESYLNEYNKPEESNKQTRDEKFKEAIKETYINGGKTNFSFNN